MSAEATITWYGHGSWGYVSPGGMRLLVDPWLEGNPKCPDALKHPEADLILLTHSHGDHIADAPAVAKRTGAQVIGKYETIVWLATHQGLENVLGFNVGGTVEAQGIRFTMTTAVHSGGLVWDDAIVGYGGEPAGYVIHFEDGTRVYQSGDTTVFSDMALIGELYRPDLAVLSIGDFYTMGPLGAAHAVRLLGVQRVLGGHWGTFPALTGTPAGLREELGKLGLGGVTVHDLEPGGSMPLAG